MSGILTVACCEVMVMCVFILDQWNGICAWCLMFYKDARCASGANFNTSSTMMRATGGVGVVGAVLYHTVKSKKEGDKRRPFSIIYHIFEFLFSQRIACSTTLLFPFSFSSTAVLTLGWSIIILNLVFPLGWMYRMYGRWYHPYSTPFLLPYTTTHYFLLLVPLAPGIIQASRESMSHSHAWSQHETGDFFNNYNFLLYLKKRRNGNPHLLKV